MRRDKWSDPLHIWRKLNPLSRYTVLGGEVNKQVQGMEKEIQANFLKKYAPSSALEGNVELKLLDLF